MSTVTDYAADAARRRAAFWHRQAVAAERLGRNAEADVMRLHAKAARETAARLEVIR